MGDQLMITAWLNGQQEVPAVTTNAEGVAAFTLNSSWDTLFYNIATKGMSGPITGIHVHTGKMGVNGSVLHNLSDNIHGNVVRGFITGSALTPSVLNSYMMGDLYVNAHTTANPNGEIRGQIMLETDWGFRASLDTMQEIMPVTKNAWGLGNFNISHDGKTLEVRVICDQLSGSITGAHLHWGKMGKDGGVAVNLSSMISGSAIIGSVDISGVTGLIDSLLAGSIYVNVHTTANAAGEIRGQLWLDKRLAFDSWLNTDQETTNPTGGGWGAAWISLNPSLDTLWYDVQATGMTGAITGAHIHDGAEGTDGNVLVSLTENINGNRISGMVTGSVITSTLVQKLLMGETYINLHTSANAGGEIRGQVYRLAREGYNFNLDSRQEVPVDFSLAMGSGMVSIDRDMTNAHFMMVVDGLSGSATAAHFHKASPGSNGGVVFNLSSFFSLSAKGDAAHGYWKSTDATPFTEANAMQFWMDSIYVNIHTLIKPTGEVRGNVMRGVHMADMVMENGMRPADPMFKGKIIFTAKLSGKEEVPEVSTTANGVAGLALNETMDTIWVVATVNGLSGPVTGVHIHEGKPGENGSVVHDLVPMLMGNQVKGYVTDFNLHKFITGQYYINVHTSANAGGEIRGQIWMDGYRSFMCDLKGSNEVPSVTTGAMGFGVVNLSPNNKKLEIQLVTNGLSGKITGAHIHKAASGMNGNVVENLTPYIMGNSIVADVDPTAYLDDLMNGMLYINVHTELNAGGEIRGQLNMVNGFVLDAWMNGAQEEPAVMAPGKGVAALWFNPTWDTLMYMVQVDEISGPLTGAHIHNGMIGENGGVDISLTDNIMGNRIWGMATGSTLTNDVIWRLLNGMSYINVHTTAFAGGEIRGQVFRTASDGYVFDMCGMQENPQVSGMRYGSGIVSVDRWNQWAHVMFSSTNLTGTVSAAHIHEGMRGANGNVLVDLSSGLSNNGSFLYATIDANTAMKIKEGKTYINAHTAMNAGGEVRGQIDYMWGCPEVSVSVPSIDGEMEMKIYPNPAGEFLVVEGSALNPESQIVLTDLVGNQLTSAMPVGDQAQLNLSGLPAGVYLLSVTTENGIYTRKIVKN